LKLHALLFLTALGAVSINATAGTESVDSACRDKLTQQVGTLEAALAANRSRFDSQMDELLTRYAASHPAAAKADYKAIFDQTFEQRFSKLFTHLNVIAAYKGVLDSGTDPGALCKMSERKMRKESDKVIAADKALYTQIASEMTRTFQ
jgi:hypothetical protein